MKIKKLRKRVNYSISESGIYPYRIYRMAVAALLTLLAGFLSFKAQPVYMANDDATMELIANGVITGEPNPYLVLSSSVIGVVLSYLYKCIPEMNWYALYLHFVYCLSFFFIYFNILQRSSFGNVVFKVVIIFILQFLLLLEIHFTIASLLLAAVSFLALIDYQINKNNANLLIGIILLSLSILIRFESLYVYIAICMPVLIFRAISNKEYKVVLFTAIVLAMGFLTTVIDHSIMSKKVGYNLFSFIRATETIIDNPNVINEEDLQKVGWSKNDLNLMMIFFFVEQKIYSVEKIMLLAKGKAGVKSFPLMVSEFSNSIMKSMIYIAILSLVFLQFITSGSKQEKIQLRSFYMLLILAAGLIIALVLLARLPFYLFLTLIMFPLLFGIYYSNYSSNKLLIPGLFFILILFLFEFPKGLSSRTELRNRLEENLIYMEKYPATTFQNINMAFYANGFYDFKSRMYGRPRNLLMFGWVIGTPAYFEHLMFHELESGHLEGLFTRRDIEIISDLEFVFQYIELQIYATYNKKIRFILHDQNGNIKSYKASSDFP
jgi:hypothetical protein